MRFLPVVSIATVLVILAIHRPISAALVPVANASFELPASASGSLNVQSWSKLPTPDWFVETPQQTWDQLAGTFRPSASEPLENLEGAQAVYLYSLPDVGLMQDLISSNSPIVYELGTSYELQFALLGNGTIKEGGSVAAILYYRDGNGKPVPAAQIVVTNSGAVFTSTTRFIDFSLAMPTVQSNQPWADRQIGIMFVSATPEALAGGIWYLDNIRLASRGELRVAGSRRGDNLRVAWTSAPEKNYELQTSTDLKSWSTLGALAQGDGSELSRLLPFAEATTLFVRVRETDP